jgi:hypothetical protein
MQAVFVKLAGWYNTKVHAAVGCEPVSFTTRVGCNDKQLIFTQLPKYSPEKIFLMSA